MLERPEQERLKADLQALMNEAKKRGATAVEVIGGVDSGFSTTVRMGNVDTLEYHNDNNFAVGVYFGQRKGSANTSDTSFKAMLETLTAACDIARYTEADPYAGLADADAMATEIPNLDLYHPWSISPEEAINLALECENKALQVDKRINNSEGATVSTSQGYHVYANSHGFIGGYPTTNHALSCSLIAEYNGEMQRDYDYTVAHDAQDLMRSDEIAAYAAHKVLSRLGARTVKTCQVPVLLDTSIAGSLIANFLSAIRGTALYRKNTFLLNQLGKQIFPSFMEIEERPHLLKAIGSAPFDGDGLLTRPKKFIEEGILKSYVLSTYTARKLGMESTANAGGVFNAHVKSSGQEDLKALVKKMHKGIIVTELMGQGVSILTGDYSRGACGFWVENGEIQYPIHGFTIAGNLKDMFANLVAVGNDKDIRHNSYCGSILLEKMMVAGE